LPQRLADLLTGYTLHLKQLSLPDIHPLEVPKAYTCKAFYIKHSAEMALSKENNVLFGTASRTILFLTGTTQPYISTGPGAPTLFLSYSSEAPCVSLVQTFSSLGSSHHGKQKGQTCQYLGLYEFTSKSGAKITTSDWYLLSQNARIDSATRLKIDVLNSFGGRCATTGYVA
jgi:hypothetical protein